MEEFKQGWQVVLAALVGIALSSSNVIIYTFGMFMPQLVAEFGWQSAGTQFALLFATLGSLIGIPLLGRVSDRFGDRAVTIGSIVAFSLAYACFALGGGSLIFFYVVTLVAATVGVGTLPITWTRLLSTWFTERRGLALGGALLGTGVGAIVLKPYTSWLIEEFGWRGAYLGIALLPLVTALPLAIRCFRTPSEVASVSSDSAAVAPSEDPAAVTGTTLKQARGDWRFWALGVAFLPISAVVGALIANMETILGAQGIAASDVVTLVTFIGVAVIVGRVGGGYLMDKVNAAVLGAALVALLAMACLLLTAPIGYWQALLVIVLLGLGSGVEYDVLAFLTSKLFGLKEYSRIYGAMLMFFFTGGAVGPVVFGAVYDSTGGYATAMYASAGVLAVAVVLLVAISRTLRGAVTEVGDRTRDSGVKYESGSITPGI